MHYWARVLRGFGHDVRLIAPQFVKPFLKSQKNDANDAEAICEAVSRPDMRFVPSKSTEQQDLQAPHRVRSRLIGCRTQLGNQIRGLLAEYGIVLPLHLSQVCKALPQLIEEENSLLSGMGRQLLAGLYEELCALERRIVAMEEQIRRIRHSNAPVPEDRCGGRGGAGDRHSGCGRHCRWACLPQRTTVRGLGRSRSTTAFQW